MTTQKTHYPFLRKSYLLITALLLANFSILSQTISGKLVDDQKKEAIIGATIRILGTNTGTISNEKGEFFLIAKEGKQTITINSLGYLKLTREITLSKNQVLNLGILEFESDDQSMSEVVVLGSRRSDRTVIDSPVPIDIIGAKEIQSTGATQTIEMLQALIPSFNTFKNSITDATDYVRPAQLRGLGPEHVLVLVNGKRRHTSSVVHDNEQARGSVSVDLNSIPPSAIERIEVLRDGAAAQYGSDAIAGVINLVLKKSTDLEVTLNYGQNLSHEQRGYKAGESLNGTNTDQSLLGTGFYENWTDKTSEKWHYDGQSFIAGISKGFQIGKGTINASFQYWSQGKSDRAGLDPNFQYFGKTKVGQKPIVVNSALLKTDTVSLDPREAGFDRENWWFGKSKLDDYSGFLNANIPLSSTLELYAFGGYSRRNGSGPCFWRQPNGDNNVRSINPDGYLPNVRPVNLDFSMAGGLKFKLANWIGDVSANYGHNDFNFKGITQNVSLGDVGDIADPALNARTSFDGGGTKFSQFSANIDLSKEFEIGLASPLNIAGGFEFRNENYEIYAGERASYENGLQKIQDGPNAGKVAGVGCQCVQAFHKLDETSQSRQNTAIFIDTETDLIKNLSFGVAARFENYTDFGSNFNWKASGRFEVLKGVAIRGAYSTGFRAPALQQQFYSNRSLQATSTGDLSQTGTFPVGTPIAGILGAKPLKAEKSTSYSGGITYNNKNFSLSVDAYHVIVENRIILSEQFQGLKDASGKNKLALYLDTLAGDNKDFKGIQQLNYFTNGLNTKTTGLDIIARYNFNISNNDNLKVTLSANFTKTKITNNAEIGTPKELSKYSATPLLGHTNQVTMEFGSPRCIINMIFNYNHKNFGVTYRPTYFGEITAAERFSANNPINDQTYKGTLIHNLEISESLINKALRLSLGANNLLDTYPEKRFKSMSRTGILPYSGYVPYGFTGRYVYVRLQYNLKN